MIAPHFIELIAHEMKIKPEQVETAIGFFNKGATVPFVARYRKDATGGLSENKLERIAERNEYFIALSSRRDAILENIEKQGKMADELRAAFDACVDHVALEDLSLPFKKQRNNRAAIAANKGLLPLADYIWAQSSVSPPPALYAESFVVVDKQVLSVEEALEGARYILAECIAMNADIRREVRECLLKEGKLSVHHTRVETEHASRYGSFHNFQQIMEEVPNDILLTILRGEREGALRVELVVDDDRLLEQLSSRFVQDAGSAYAEEIRAAVSDAYKRLLRPVIEEEVFAKARRKAEEAVIANCRDHLRSLLLTAPAGPVPVIGICCWSSQLRTIAAVDGEGAVQASCAVEGDSEETLAAKMEEALVPLLNEHPAVGIGISGGPGGRETLRFVQSLINRLNMRVFTALVQDTGLAAYAHSTIAAEELSGMDDMVRAAVSIARRLQDPLRELVKVEPCSLIPARLAAGVNRKHLQAGAVKTIESVVNRVGVDVNTAAVESLRYISGLQLGVAQALVEKRKELGKFNNRSSLLEVSGIGEKTYQQCAGFLRIADGENPLDGSAIHPESYPMVDKMLGVLQCFLPEVMEMPEKLHALDLAALADEVTGPLTLEDICYELGRIGRDSRRRFRPPQNLVPLNTLEDLEEQMVLEGIVTNITDFGIFVNLGLPQEGLVHRSEVGRGILNDPKRSLQVGNVVKVVVLQVDREANKIALSIKGAVKLPLSRPKPRRLPQAGYAGDSANRSDRDFLDGPRRGSRPGNARQYGERGTQAPSSGASRRRRDKNDMAVPRISRGEGKKEEKSLLNTSLAEQLAALRDKIISSKK